MWLEVRYYAVSPNPLIPIVANFLIAELFIKIATHVDPSNLTHRFSPSRTDTTTESGQQ